MLRKLHELPGSAVFLDEAHAALPSELWPVCWNWLMEWTSYWNGHLVLGSGSLAEFWKLSEFRSITENREPGLEARKPVAEVLPLSEPLRESTRKAEHLRIRFDTRKEPVSAEELIEWVEGSPGPRLVIVNTVQSAATLAKLMEQRGRQKIVHLSTALAPIHRAIIIDRIKELLRHRKDWTLVATSLVEAGMNFSFSSAFRQRCSSVSLIQTGGRVNRGAEMDEKCLVWDFDFSDLATFPDNPTIAASKRALYTLFSSGWLNPETPADLAKICLEALKMEFKPGAQLRALKPVAAELEMNYPEVSQLCKVIQSDTRLVVIDSNLVERIRSYERVSRTEIIQRSINVYPDKVMKLGFERVFDPVFKSSTELFALPNEWEYDPDCYGYMAEWLRLKDASIPNGYFI